MADASTPRTGRAFAPYPFVAERFPAVLPPLRDGVDRSRHRVAIVGAGPVGYCVAIGLAVQGIDSVLIEADDSVCAGSRAICISRRSLEIIDRLGALPGFLATGLPWTGGRSFYREREVLRFTMPNDANQRLPPMLNLAQYHIEQILLERARELSDRIDLRWQTRLTGLEPHADGVRARLATPLGDYALEADWLVATDGGRSVVRESLGLALTGTNYEGRYVIVDVAMPSDRPTERLAFFDPPCNPGSTVLVHKQPQDVWRIDYQLRRDEDAEAAVRPENVLPRVESLLAMIGETAAWAPIWISLYRANALTLERYRHGRVLFAGDAAHLVPIFGVRGANSGIDDADNLAWKLAAVLQGLATDRLLDSYSEERVAAAKENLRHGTKSTEFMAPPSFAFEWMRTAVLGLAVRHESVRSLINPRQTSPIAYTGSALSRAVESSADFAAGPAPGSVLVEAPLGPRTPSLRAADGHGAYLTQLLGGHFALLHFSKGGTLPADLGGLDAEMRGLGIRWRTVLIDPGTDDATATLAARYDAANGASYLVRPDGHVLARWRRCAAKDVRLAVARVLDRIGAHGGGG